MAYYQGDKRSAQSTVYVGNLDERVDEDLLWELMVQAGPVTHIHIPRDRVSEEHQGYGFVEFKDVEDSEYAVKIMNMINLFGRPVRVNRSLVSKDGETAAEQDEEIDIGANLYIGGLTDEVDETLLHRTFSAFGVISKPPKVAYDLETGEHRGFGFVSFDSFEASDRAIAAMNGQFFCGKTITVSYAFRKDGKDGERHGSYAERLLAAQNPNRKEDKPNMRFADAPSVPAPGAGGAAPATTAPMFGTLPGAGGSATGSTAPTAMDTSGPAEDGQGMLATPTGPTPVSFGGLPQQNAQPSGGAPPGMPAYGRGYGAPPPQPMMGRGYGPPPGAFGRGRGFGYGGPPPQMMGRGGFGGPAPPMQYGAPPVQQFGRGGPGFGGQPMRGPPQGQHGQGGGAGRGQQQR